MNRKHLVRAIQHPAFLSTQLDVIAFAFVIGVILVADRSILSDEHFAALIVLLLYYPFGQIFLNQRLISGRWNINRWVQMVACYYIPPILYYLYFSIQNPQYAFLPLCIAISGPLLGMGLLRRRWYLGLAAIFSFAYLAIWLEVFQGSLVENAHHLTIVVGFILVMYFEGVASSQVFESRKNVTDLLLRSRKDKRLIAEARRRADSLLLNILPDVVAEELKETGSTEPVYFDSASVMFTDFKGFTQIAEGLSPRELVVELDRCFSYFDSLMDRYNLEKLKTIGDSFMCAGGVPAANHTHAIDCVLAALEIQSFMNQMKELKSQQGLPYWELRLGIHSGPLVAGVIGEKKFAYDDWGDTVNTASRAESSGAVGRINITGETRELIKDFFDTKYRGSISAKNKGEIEMYFVEGIKAGLSQNAEGRVPNLEFGKLYKRMGGMKLHRG